MSRELLPCPFCGGDAELCVGYHMLVDAKVQCRDCSAEGPPFGTDAKKGEFTAQAIQAWNTRK